MTTTLDVILIVDDDANNLYSMKTVLEKEGREIVTVDSGDKALKHLLEKEVSLILIDVNMPEMSGFDTIQIVKAREQTRDIPVLFITSLIKNIEQVTFGYKMGAYDYIQRPIDNELLRQKVNVFLKIHRQRLEQTEELNKLTHEHDEMEDARLHELRERELRSLERLSSSTLMDDNQKHLGKTLLRVSRPDVFKKVVERFATLLERAIEQRTYKIEYDISKELRGMAERLGFLDTGPKDVVDVFCTAVKLKIAKASSRRAQVFMEEGRLLAFELMGYLVTHYRGHSVVSRDTIKKDARIQHEDASDD